MPSAYLDALENGEEVVLKQNYDDLFDSIKSGPPQDVIESIKNEASRYVQTIVLKHLKCENDEISQRALQFFGFLLSFDETVVSLDEECIDNMIQEMISILRFLPSKIVTQRCLWCFSQEKLLNSAVEKRIVDILALTKKIFEEADNASVSPLVELEVVAVLQKLWKCCPNRFFELFDKWFYILLRCCVSPASKVREKAFGFFEIVAPNLKNLNFSNLLDELKPILKVMMDLTEKRASLYVVPLWIRIVETLGDAMQKSTAFLNTCLPIVEKAFKSDNVNTKCLAYEAWRSLINTLGRNLNYVTEKNRLKLLLQPLLVNSRTAEQLAIEKVKTWIVLINVCGPKLESLFDRVCLPLLRFCVGGEFEIVSNISASDFSTPKHSSKTPTMGTPQTPKLFLMNIEKSSIGPKSLPCYSVIQGYIGELLLKFLCGECKVDGYKGSLDDLQVNACICSPEALERNALLFAQCLRVYHSSLSTNDRVTLNCWEVFVDKIISLKKNLPLADFECLVESVFQHLKLFVEECSLESTALLSLFTKLFNMLSKTVVRLKSLKNVEASDSIILYFLPCLLNKIDFSVADKRVTEFFDAVGRAIAQDGEKQVLNDVEEFLNIVSAFEVKLPGVLRFRIWMNLSTAFLEYLYKTNEINQGSGLEINFTCVYGLLAFPFVHISMEELTVDDVDSLTRKWRNVLLQSLRCAGLNCSTETNTFLEDFCGFLTKNSDISFNNVSSLLFASVVCRTVVENLKPTVDSNDNNVSLRDLSPSKMHRRFGGAAKTSNVQVPPIPFLQLVFSGFVEFLDKNKLEGSKSLEKTICNLLVVLKQTFQLYNGKVRTMKILFEKFLNFLAHLISDVHKIPSYPSRTILMEYLRTVPSILDVVKANTESDGFNSECLQQMSSLLDVIFSHGTSNLRKAGVSFWQETFGQAKSLRYPEKLKATLIKLNKNTPIVAPDLNCSNPSVQANRASIKDSETSPDVVFVDMDSTESLLSVASIKSKIQTPTFATPVESSTFHSPAKSTRSSRLRKKLKLDNDALNNEEVLVYVPPVEKQTMVLTERQKEKFSEKKEMPFLDRMDSQIINHPAPEMFVTESQMIDSAIEAQPEEKHCSPTNVNETSHCDDEGDVMEIVEFPISRPKSPTVLVQRLSQEEIQILTQEAKNTKWSKVKHVKERALSKKMPKCKSDTDIQVGQRVSPDSEIVLSSQPVLTSSFLSTGTPLKWKASFRSNGSGTSDEICGNKASEINDVVVPDSCVNFVHSDVLDDPSSNVQEEENAFQCLNKPDSQPMTQIRSHPSQANAMPFQDGQNVVDENSDSCHDRRVDIVDTLVLQPDGLDTYPLEAEVSNNDSKIAEQNNVEEELNCSRNSNESSMKSFRTPTKIFIDDQAVDLLEDGVILKKPISPGSTPSAATILRRKRMRKLQSEMVNDRMAFSLTPPPAGSRQVHFAPELISNSDDEMEKVKSSPRKRQRPSPVAEELVPAKRQAIGPQNLFAQKFSARTHSIISRIGRCTGSKQQDCNDSSFLSTLDNVVLTRESALDNTQSIWPSLAESCVDVALIVPMLVGSSWEEGLLHELRNKNIETVGHLARLSELDVHHLPIKQPKLEVLKKAFESFVRKENVSMQHDSSTELDISGVIPMDDQIETDNSLLETSVDRPYVSIDERELDKTLESVQVIEEPATDEFAPDKIPAAKRPSSSSNSIPCGQPDFNFNRSSSSVNISALVTQSNDYQKCNIKDVAAQLSNMLNQEEQVEKLSREERFELCENLQECLKLVFSSIKRM